MKQKRLVILIACVLAVALAHSVFGAGKTEGTVKIGAIIAVTGPAANLGAPEARTLEMMVEELNAAGGVAGRKIQLVLKDSQASADKAFSFAKQLIDEEAVLAIIGPTTSGESMKIKDLCNEAETILISCSAAETLRLKP